MSAANPSDSWLGKFLGEHQRYRLEQPLGNGAIGDVYLSMDMRLGRRVAIKVLKGTMAKSQEMLVRFEREIAVLAALESEHIVQVLDYGITPEGYPFYVMEYLRGQTLSQLMARSQRLSVELTVRIATQICEGLRIAHEGVKLWKPGMIEFETVKVIHRDLKPANIFLVPTAVGALVKVLDFGIAKKLHASEQSEQTNLTQAFLGTYHYAAPEQLRNARNLDERADIYSLGLILYEMLCGTDAFGVIANKQPQKEVSWAMSHATVVPTPLRQQPGCEQLPAALESAIMRCLCKSADERFASIAELSRSLTAIVQTIQNIPRSAASAAGEPTHSVANDPTIHNPIAPVSAPQNPTVFRPIVPSSPSVDQTMAQIPVAHPSPQVPPDETIAQPAVASSPPSPPDVTIFQSPANKPQVDVTLLQTPAPPNAITDATIAQSPRPILDQTIAQTSSNARVDATLFQAPGVRPAVDQTQLQLPRQDYRSNTVNNTVISQAPNLLHEPAPSVVVTPLQRWLKMLLPLSIGFGLGVAVIIAMFAYLRSPSKKESPQSSRNQPALYSPTETSGKSRGSISL
jgi:eukaryotic-like serine/threonine-protein kinase